MFCGACASGSLKTLPFQWHIHVQLIWEYNPRALKCFAFENLDQQELINVISNALLSDFIRVVVLPLLSRGINFHKLYPAGTDQTTEKKHCPKATQFLTPATPQSTRPGMISAHD